MVSQKVTIINAQGFHMRPATVFAAAMAKHQSSVFFKYNGNKINAKSLMDILAGCLKCGYEIEVECDGADEKETLQQAVEMIESGLGE